MEEGKIPHRPPDEWGPALAPLLLLSRSLYLPEQGE